MQEVIIMNIGEIVETSLLASVKRPAGLFVGTTPFSGKTCGTPFNVHHRLGNAVRLREVRIVKAIGMYDLRA